MPPTPGCWGRRGQPRGCTQVLPPSRPWWLCPDLTCPSLPQASACWPGAMRCSLKRSVTAALAASFLLLLLLLHGGSWKEEDPLEVSPPPVTSRWRGRWSILHPPLPHTNPNPGSAPFPAPWHPQTPALPSSLPEVALHTWVSPDPGAGRSGQGFPLISGALLALPPCSHASMVLWGLTWLPAAPIQVELRGLAPETILQMLKPEGALRILRDTEELSALHNISYHLLAGSLSPRRSEWLGAPGLGRAVGSMEGWRKVSVLQAWPVLLLQLGTGASTDILGFPDLCREGG